MDRPWITWESVAGPSDATDMDQNWVTWRAPPLTTRPLALPAASAAEGWQRQRAQRAPIMCTTADLVTLAASGRRYPCIYADPPWPYGNHVTSGAAQKHYECMSIDALCACPSPGLRHRTPICTCGSPTPSYVKVCNFSRLGALFRDNLDERARQSGCEPVTATGR
jgi:hypothetical protein